MFNRYTARPRCIRCCTGWLNDRLPEAPSNSLQIDRIHCRGCGELFDAWGDSPLLLEFGANDMPRVIEMVAVPMRRGHRRGLPKQSLFDSLAAYHSADDVNRAILVTGNPALADSPMAGSAYSDWAHTNALLAGTNRRGSSVLKIGGGTGIDEIALNRAGMRITCLEWHLPTLIDAQRTHSPAAWIGGVAEHIPFDDDSFDLVYANAVLEDVTSPQHALHELLRVVRVGGQVMVSQIALGSEWDCRNHSRTAPRRLASQRAAIPFTVLSSMLAEFGDAIAVALVVDVDRNEDLEGRSPIGIDGSGGFWTPAWSANMAVLARASGYISLSIVKKASVTIAPRPAASCGGVPTTCVALWVDSAPDVPRRIAPWIEPTLLCTGPIQEDYQMHEWSLGWGPVAGQPSERMAHWQARWLIPCHDREYHLSFEICLQGLTSGSVDLLIDGVVIETVTCTPEWSRVTAMVGGSPDDTVAILEFVLVAADPVNSGTFKVRNRQVSLSEDARTGHIPTVVAQ